MDVDGWVERVVGPYRSVADRSWDHGDSHVVQIRDTAGVTWFVKAHRHAHRYAREVDAYRRWVPVLGRHAPRLHDHDPDLSVLLLSSVPGTPATEATDDIQHQAGRLLRSLHDAEAPVPWPDFAEQQHERFDKWLPRVRPLLDARSIDFVAAQVAGLAGVTPDAVPCHLDYSPRNWLVADGVLHVIDFEWARPHCWPQDLSRLFFGLWQRSPAAREAFLDGYGRPLAGDDLAVLLALGAASAMSTVAWAREHGDTEFEAAGRRDLAALVAGDCR
jgi:tRNA A-37 threonylcarbamoyl transferase component Bud32